MASGPEELLGIPRQLQVPDPLLDVVLVSLLVPFDPGTNLGLLLAPLGDIEVVERLLDLPVQLVQVDLIDPVLELGVMSVQFLDGAAVELSEDVLELPPR